MGWYPDDWQTRASSANDPLLYELENRVAQLEYLIRVDRLLAGSASATGTEVSPQQISERPTYRTANVALAGGGSQVIRYIGTA